MKTRITAQTFKTLDINDKKTIIAIVLKKTHKYKPQSAASVALLAILHGSNLPLEDQLIAIQNYILNADNHGRHTYKVIERAITKTQQATAEANTEIKSYIAESGGYKIEDGEWKISDILYLSEEIQLKVINQLRHFFHANQPTSIHSKLVCDAVLGNEPAKDIWAAIIYYLQQKQSQHRNTFATIGQTILQVLNQETEKLIINRKFDEAFIYMKIYFRNHRHSVKTESLIIHSILQNSFKKEYLDLYDLSKSAYLHYFYSNEILAKTVQDINKLPPAAVLLGPLEILVRTPLSFFAQQARTFHHEAAIATMLQDLSQLSHLLRVEEKKQMLDEIVATYENKTKLSKSSDSQTLVDLLTTGTNPHKNWQALLLFVLASDGLVLKHNGSRLFNTIKTVAQEKMNGIFAENTCPTIL